MMASVVNAPVYIYALHDPRAPELYIGATVKSVHRRKAEHVCTAYVKTDRTVSRWIRSIIESGRDLDVVVLNQREGGLGAHGSTCTAETRAKISRSRMGQKIDPERAARLSAAGANALRGKQRPPEVRAKISAAHIARRDRLRQERLNGAIDT